MTAGIAIGVLSTLCVVLIVFVFILLAQNKKKDEVIGGMAIRFNVIEDLIKNIPRNIIHLDLKSLDVDTKLPLVLPIKPENFVVNVEKLKKLLLERLEKEKSEDPYTKALCILDHAGLGSVVDGPLSNLSKPLARLLINDDIDSAKKYLETLAESICAKMI